MVYKTTNTNDNRYQHDVWEFYMSAFNNIKSGNLLSDSQGSCCESELFYKGLIYHYEKKLREHPKCISTLYYWIASYHELSIIYQDEEEMDLALNCLLIPYQSIIDMSKKKNGDLEQQLIAMKVLKDTLTPLMQFTERNPTCGHCMQQLKSQLKAVENNYKVNH